MEVRGIRNNNPGNIEYIAHTRWQGLAANPTDGRFCVFKGPTWGIRALARVLITYQDKYNINTVRGFINRWAPDHENDTSAYSRHVAHRMGINENTKIDVTQFNIMSALVQAIITHENGKQPYTEQQITKGLLLAGIEPDKEPLTRSRTIRGGQLATASVTGAAGVNAIEDVASQIEPLTGYSDYILYAFLALTFLGIAWMVWARVDDSRKGLR